MIVGYDIDDKDRMVNAYVIDSSDKMFERTALSAIEKFTYKAKLFDNIAVVQKGLQFKFTFGLENEI